MNIGRDVLRLLDDEEMKHRQERKTMAVRITALREIFAMRKRRSSFADIDNVHEQKSLDCIRVWNS